MGELVNLLNTAGGAFVAFAGHMLIQSSVLIVILAALDLVLRKRVKAVVRYWIWLLILAKLLLPPSLSSPTSLVSWVGSRLPKTTLVSLTPASPFVVPETISGAAPTPMDTAPRPQAAEGPVSEASPLSTAPIRPVVLPTWPALVLLAWGTAVLLMGVLLLQRVAFVHGLMAQSQEAPDALRALLEQCRRQMAVRRGVGIRLTCLSVSPSVCGLLRPVILMPEPMIRQLGTPQLRSVLLHELAHLQRGDLWINLLQTLLQIVYLYHPLLWLANARIRAVREQAVDETVLAALGEEAEEYPRTLLSISKLAFGRPSLSLRLLGVVESEKALTTRIRHMVSRPFPKSAKLGCAGLVSVLIVGALLLPMASAAPERAQAEGVSPAGGLPAASEVIPASAITPPGSVAAPQAKPAERAEVKVSEKTVGESGAFFRLSPRDEADEVGIDGLELTWVAVPGAKSYNICLGTRPDDLPLLGQVEQVGATVSHLKCNTKYYWRVDEVRTDGSVVSGKVNAFTTGGLVAWWRLDETSGDVAHDSSGNGNAGTLEGNAKWQPAGGRVGGALELDGRGSFVSMGNQMPFNVTTAVSVAAWIKVRAFDRPWQTIVAKGDASWRLARDRERDALQFGAGRYEDNRVVHGGIDVNDGKWHQVVGVSDAESVSLYVDGVLDQAATVRGRMRIDDAPVYLGENSDPKFRGRHWNGWIDELCVFTYPLSVDEVKALYSGTTPTALTAPAASSEARIVLAPLDTRARPVPAKSPFPVLATANLNAWVGLHVLEERVLVLDAQKVFSNYWAMARYKAVGLFAEKEALEYVQGRLKDNKSLPLRIDIHYRPEANSAAQRLRGRVASLAREVNADLQTELRLQPINWTGSGVSPFFLREGKIRTFYPDPVRRPDGRDDLLFSGVVDPNDLEQHFLWRLLRPGNVPLTFRIEYDEASAGLAKQVADTAKAVVKRVGLAELVEVTGALVEPVPETVFLGRWQAITPGEIQTIEVQPRGLCQVTMGKGTEAFKAGANVPGTWLPTSQEIMIDIKDKVEGQTRCYYKGSVNADGNLVVDRSRVWPQGSIHPHGPSRTIFQKVK
jgi:beta-lactamase regulating signal transducer with metallopeptidase domain